MRHSKLAPHWSNVGPDYVGTAGACPYCRVETRMYGQAYADCGTGDAHTCVRYVKVSQFAPQYVNGRFWQGQSMKGGGSW